MLRSCKAHAVDGCPNAQDYLDTFVWSEIIRWCSWVTGYRPDALGATTGIAVVLTISKRAWNICSAR